MILEQQVACATRTELPGRGDGSGQIIATRTEEKTKAPRDLPTLQEDRHGVYGRTQYGTDTAAVAATQAEQAPRTLVRDAAKNE